MKKMMLIVVLVLLISTVFAETVILNNGKQLKGEIVGKNEDSIYLLNGAGLKKISFEAIETIKNEGGQPITKKIMRKKVFMNAEIGEYEIEEIQYSAPVIMRSPAGNLKFERLNIEEMTDREFQLYLTQMQVNELNGIRKTQWKIWGASIGVGVGLTLITMLIAGG